jgi:hypothetical protein
LIEKLHHPRGPPSPLLLLLLLHQVGQRHVGGEGLDSAMLPLRCDARTHSCGRWHTRRLRSNRPNCRLTLRRTNPMLGFQCLCHGCGAELRTGRRRCGCWRHSTMVRGRGKGEIM